MKKVYLNAIDVLDGPGPNEKIVTVCNNHHEEFQVIVDAGSIIHCSWLEVMLIQTDTKKLLIELPRESADGSHRLWVSPFDIKTE